jgi:hypothetical protein
MSDSQPTSHPHVAAIEALASWALSGDRSRDRRQVVQALDTMAKEQQQRYSPDDRLDAALRLSYARLDAEHLRNCLLRALVGPGYPLDLLNGFAWKFGTSFDQLTGDELVAAIRTFLEDLYGKDFDPSTEEVCRPDEEVLRSGDVVVIGCSYPPQGQPRFFQVQLHSDNGASFRAGELMSKLVGAVAGELADSCHRFFLGLRLVDKVGNPGACLPLYEMCFSSDSVPPGLAPTIGWGRLNDEEQWRRRGVPCPSR